ncbi:magnesium-transporting ATPase (P-type) [Virgibacillus halotolerans]|uniref:hypothetical protein n=1 Tax=Virgibacillus halotolerans TaxID=1071053 RepID=UPI00196005AD|nr:hypothetical protein [Virgibacillus halotolerans]MBM7598930.1 magnesium-transporting ATPase (P-type) [Virgibacillus halotolerans]
MVHIIMLAGLIVPWFTLFFTSPEERRRYMPVTIFTSLLMTIIFQIAYTYEWWIMHKQIVPWGYMIDVSFVYGVFAVGTFWIFRFTSHGFLLYIVVNIIMDAFMAFIALPFLSVLDIATYENIAPWEYFLVIFGLSFIIYFYHKWQQKIYKSD